MSEIRSAAKDGYLVIAYLHHHHWASDWYEVSSWVGDVAKACIAAGAAMFVSHGAPVLQPVEIYRNRPIFYSLGNFIFHVKSEKSQWTAAEIWESVIGLCAFNEAGELTAIDFHPVVIGASSSGQHTMLEERLMPHLAQGADADRILKRFQEQSISFGSKLAIKDGTAQIIL